MNKIGILTYHNCINHGAFLQAYALQNVLQSFNKNVEIINYKSFKYTFKELYSFIHKRNPKKTFINLMKIHKFHQEHKYYSLSKRIYREKKISGLFYSSIFVGSDSVFNFTNDYAGFDPVYFGQNLNSKNLFSYAASFGPDNIENGYPEELALLFKQFKKFGVRDNNSKQFLNSLGFSNVQLVLDPTLLFDFTYEFKYPKYTNYILIYGFGIEKNTQDQIIEFAHKKNLTLISIGYSNPWCDHDIVNISPFEWLGYIKNAQYIITGMYHGTLFSIKYNKPFISLMTSYRKNKLGDFLSLSGLEDRMYGGTIDFNNIDFSNTNKFLEDKKKASLNFIKNCIYGDD